MGHATAIAFGLLACGCATDLFGPDGQTGEAPDLSASSSLADAGPPGADGTAAGLFDAACPDHDGAAPLRYDNGREYPAGFSGPGVNPGDWFEGVAAGDLDGDGRTDVLVMEKGQWNVLYGSPGGGLEPGAPGLVDQRQDLASPLIADLDGDGRLDFALVVATDGAPPYDLRVHLNAGGRRFIAVDGLHLGDWHGQTWFHWSAVDLDGDHRLDLLICPQWTRGGETSLAVSRGLGQGRFSAAVPIATGGDCRGLASGDLDGDGRIDVAMADYGHKDWAMIDAGVVADSAIRIFSGRGDGSFRAGATLQPGNRTIGLAALDTDGDGDLDLLGAHAVGSSGLYGLVAWVNDGAGSFRPDAELATDGSAGWFVPADLDGDGRSDLVFLDYVQGARSQDTASRIEILQFPRAGMMRLLTVSSQTVAGWGPLTGDIACDGRRALLYGRSIPRTVLLLAPAP